jgi:hypothetical protein
MEYGFITEHNFDCKKVRLLQALKERHCKIYTELHSLGQLHVTTVNAYSFKISNVFAEFFTMLRVVCLIVGQRA